MADQSKSPPKIAVLASGSGTNLQALLDAELGPGTIALVIVNVPGVEAIERAQRAGVEVQLIDHKRFAKRADFDAAVVEALKKRQIDWVVFAGFMRVVTATLLSAFEGRIVNIHPSLLPAFPGLDAQRQAFEAGVKITGCTVHLVDAGVDTGPILAQVAVPILPEDTLSKLRARILKQEHRVLPAVVRALCEGRLARDEAGRVYLSDSPSGSAALMSPPLDAKAAR